MFDEYMVLVKVPFNLYAIMSVVPQMEPATRFLGAISALTGGLIRCVLTYLLHTSFQTVSPFVASIYCGCCSIFYEHLALIWTSPIQYNRYSGYSNILAKYTLKLTATKCLAGQQFILIYIRLSKWYHGEISEAFILITYLIFRSDYEKVLYAWNIAIISAKQ